MGYEEYVLVTGSSRGIGYFIAHAFARNGENVVIATRDRLRGESVAGELRDRYKVEAAWFRLDFREKELIDRLVDELETSPKALVVNTGNPLCEPCDILEAGYEDWIDAAKIYLAGPLYLASRLLEKAIIASAPLSITFISSISIVEPMRYLVVADTVRAGITRWAKIVSRIYGRNGIRSNVLLLGSYDTPGARALIKKISDITGDDADTLWKREVVGRIPCGRVGDPEELGQIVYDITLKYKYLSGAAIPIDCSMSRSVLV